MKQKLRHDIFDLALNLSHRKPCYVLHATRKGLFWHPMEKILASIPGELP
ncbi:MAG: hypothetical protein GY757_47420 [bacterium]|nr:hypothetical protein [bacterium]